MLKCFRNRNPEVKGKEGFTLLFRNFLDSLHNWVHVAKVYTIFHVALQDECTMRIVATELVDREKQLYHYVNRPDARDYSKVRWQCVVENRHSELSQSYASYIKKLANFVSKCEILEVDPKKVDEFLESTSCENLFWIFNQLMGFINLFINKVASPHNQIVLCEHVVLQQVQNIQEYPETAVQRRGQVLPYLQPVSYTHLTLPTICSV
eukprot:TRINITY_DN9651_c0_g3_i4.p1 TRINITY_DN9651_c0_g3~~TRINITY_DN9651_c0_g3_i4.p1  ORF type:complete len:208 (-),score=39.80 TRINITY_DN9651_c0_g3_i4:43-666(-)